MNVVFRCLRIDMKVTERLAKIGGNKQGSDLDADQQPVFINDNVLHVPNARGRRETPIVNAWDLSKRFKLPPGFARIFTDV